jgi:CRP/FNR family transcriptional regulator
LTVISWRKRFPRQGVSHQELADELGTVGEMITRLLKSFADSGLIASGREEIQILDESALKHIFEN